MNIELSKIYHILDWIKRQLYLDSISETAKNRIVYRGEVYECDLGIGVGSEMQKNRPCLIIQANIGNINSGNVIIAPITHTNKPIPSMAHILPYIPIMDNYYLMDKLIYLIFKLLVKLD